MTFTVTPGASGASGTFASSPSMPILTNASGIATAPTLTANGVAGTFTVTASVNALSVTFNLTNVISTVISALGELNDYSRERRRQWKRAAVS